MSTLPGNPHADTATSRLRNGTSTEVARAQAEATLALAFEQRTANLINLAAYTQADGVEVRDEVIDDIADRLGLSNGANK